MGEWLVGPSIIVHGTDAQKAYFLPRIIDGTDRYCQGFSEPDAGSDLAGLKTRGVVDGDEVVITGQKVWTSGAQFASMMFCLCRTDPEAPKHRGISYVLVPMKRDDGESNGFELRPIKQITGTSGFTETFINEARAPLFNVIGGLHNGWRVTMTTLGNERGGNATTQHVQYEKQFWRLVEEVRAPRQGARPARAAEAGVGVQPRRDHAVRRACARCPRSWRGRSPGRARRSTRCSGPSTRVISGAWVMDLRGAQSMVRPDGEHYSLDRWQSDFLTSRSGTIWGGTAQVQRNIVGERVLGTAQRARGWRTQ